MFSPLNSHCYIGNIVTSKIVISGFCPYILLLLLPGHRMFIVILSEIIVILRIVISGFHCISCVGRKVEKLYVLPIRRAICENNFVAVTIHTKSVMYLWLFTHITCPC